MPVNAIVWGRDMYVKHAESVLWHPVGTDSDEILLIREGAEMEMFILSGKTAVAVWTRLDGSRTVTEIIGEMVAESGVTKHDASGILTDFIDDLESHDLIAAFSDRHTEPLKESLSPWPSSIVPPSLLPFNPEELVSSEVMALGSFIGGFNNNRSDSSCRGGEGGVNNYGGRFGCRPGAGYGFVNGGFFNTPCG